jgi:hypothetical protein
LLWKTHRRQTLPDKESPLFRHSNAIS